MRPLLPRRGFLEAPLRRLPAWLCLLVGLAPALGRAEDEGLCPGPFTTDVRIAPGNEPAGGVPVRLGGRFMTTTRAGRAIFDGVPAGTYTLSVRTLGFDVFEKEVALAPGKREAVTIHLQPERRVSLVGKVLVRDLGAPVAGAGILLTPKSVASGVQGPVECRSDWEGTFTILQLPAGTYRVDVHARGCRDLALEVDASEDGKIHEFALERAFLPARLRVQVQDALSGAPVQNAEAVLTEAYPTGEIARTKSDAGGIAVFEGLALAQINWLDAQGRASGCSRHGTIHVEAGGYAPVTEPVTLGPDASASVRIHPLRTLDEAEPNDDVATAQPVDPGTTVRFRIGRIGDQDWFKCRLPYPGRLVLEVGPANPIQILLRVLDAQGRTFCQQDVAGPIERLRRPRGRGRVRHPPERVGRQRFER